MNSGVPGNNISHAVGNSSCNQISKNGNKSTKCTMFISFTGITFLLQKLKVVLSTEPIWGTKHLLFLVGYFMIPSVFHTIQL
jgi:hypothetical protein